MSADAFLGVPLNITSYSVLTHIIAQIVGLELGEFIWNGGDCHIYLNHIEQVKEQLSREFKELPTLWIDPNIDDITKLNMDSVKMIDYDCHPVIKAPMSV